MSATKPKTSVVLDIARQPLAPAEPCSCGSGIPQRAGWCPACQCAWQWSNGIRPCWRRHAEGSVYCEHHIEQVSFRDHERAVESVRQAAHNLASLQRYIVRHAYRTLLPYTRALRSLESAGESIGLVMAAHGNAGGPWHAWNEGPPAWKGAVYPDEWLSLWPSGNSHLHSRGEENVDLDADDLASIDERVMCLAECIVAELSIGEGTQPEQPPIYVEEIRNAGVMEKVRAALIYIGVAE